ncbi:MAG: hypothetical protein Q8N51_09690 [Gammaproteobacteria bacterium]|nr:hypothetical protein [Gammaproteobacteria bacterium]
MPDFTQMPSHLAQALLARERAARQAFPSAPRPTPRRPTLDDVRRMLVAANPSAQGIQIAWKHKPTICFDRQDKVSRFWSAVVTVTAPGYHPRAMVLVRTSKGTDLR